ncbi:MAG: hypothetical protein RL199_2435, partial [Pseudomonadota bacterium]
MSSKPRRPLFIADDAATPPSTPSFVRDGQLAAVRIRPLFPPRDDSAFLEAPAFAQFVEPQTETFLEPPPEPVFAAVSAAPVPAPPMAPPPPAKVPDELARRFGEAVAQVRGLAERLETDAVADVVELGLAVARALLHEELSTRPERVLAIVREAIHQLGPSTRYTIRLHPQELSAVRSAAGHGLLGESGAEQIRVEADPTLGRGDCVVDGDPGRADSR